ncbi:MAG: AAA family ATPase [Sulfitobacter sp.]
MYDHEHLAALQARSLAQQEWIRSQTYAPGQEKRLRRFSSWEVAELILKVNQSTLRSRIAADETFPTGKVEQDGRQRWYSLEEVGQMRRRLSTPRKSMMPMRPGGRAFRAAVANFKGGAGKSTVALHLAHAAALDGYKVLLIDFDPQATLSHSMGLTDVEEENTVWGVIARDLARETTRMNAGPVGAESGARAVPRTLPASIRDLGLDTREAGDFIRPTSWPTIDMVPSCANAAFVEFASAQYRALNPEWSFFACVSRYLAEIPDEAYDLILFDCPPAIGYQSMNAVFAADMLMIPSGPGYWEYDSTTSFIGQLADALEDLNAGFGKSLSTDLPRGEGFGTATLPKAFPALRFLMTRYEPGNELHQAMFAAFKRVFGDHVAEHPVELTRAVEQSGRFLNSVYEMDYRDMTRETWRRARATFDKAYEGFIGDVHAAWPLLEAAQAAPDPASEQDREPQLEATS